MAWDLSGSLEEWDTSPLRPYDITVLPDGSAWLTYRDMPVDDWPVGKDLYHQPLGRIDNRVPGTIGMG